MTAASERALRSASPFTLLAGVRRVLPGCKFLHDLGDLKDYITGLRRVSAVLDDHKTLSGFLIFTYLILLMHVYLFIFVNSPQSVNLERRRSLSCGFV